MKRRMITGLVVLLAFLLVGCGTSGGKPNPQEPAKAVDTPEAKEFIAKGITAEEAGKPAEALFWYYYADALGATSPESKARLEALSGKMKSGNPWGITGNSAQVEIALGKQWPEMLNGLMPFFTQNAELVRDSLRPTFTAKLNGKGSLNKQDETMTYEYNVGLDTGSDLYRADNDIDMVGYNAKIKNHAVPNTLNDIYKGYRRGLPAFTNPYTTGLSTDYFFDLELVNGNGKVIAETSTQKPHATLSIVYYNGYHYRYDAFSIFHNTLRDYYNYNYDLGSFTVSINDITDEGMKVRIKKVDQYTRDANNNPVFVKTVQ